MSRGKRASIEERLGSPIVLIFDEDIEEWVNEVLERVHSKIGGEALLGVENLDVANLDIENWEERIKSVNNLLQAVQEATWAEVNRLAPRIKRLGSSYVAVASGGFDANRRGTFQIESVEEFLDDLYKIALDRLLDIVLPQD
jgi:single-stranded DNA-specific DHH superfamily exonuclease